MAQELKVEKDISLSELELRVLLGEFGPAWWVRAAQIAAERRPTVEELERELLGAVDRSDIEAARQDPIFRLLVARYRAARGEMLKRRIDLLGPRVVSTYEQLTRHQNPFIQMKAADSLARALELIGPSAGKKKREEEAPRIRITLLHSERNREGTLVERALIEEDSDRGRLAALREHLAGDAKAGVVVSDAD